jgi:hypothetical protein
MKLSELSTISESKLLNTRICDLEVSLNQTPLMRGINDLYFELNSKLINFLPQIWLSSDWFSPDGVSGFAVPFYLIHPRLIKLELKNTGLIEGHTYKSLMQLLRHETGHAIDNAFHLRKSKKRQKLFGLSSTKYPSSYVPKADNKNYVRHLEEFYAQAHPDEDWAETFAVWLDPKSKWKKKYQSWNAIEKLDFVDQQMDSLKGKKQLSSKVAEVDSISKDTRTINEYYKEKRKLLRLNKRSIIEQVDSNLLKFIVTNPTQTKKMITKSSKNKFISEKIVKEIIKKCKNKSFPLEYSHTDLLEENLNKLTQAYIKEGRHKVIM